LDYFARLAGDFSISLSHVCVALLVAVPASAARRVLQVEVDRLDEEMRVAILDLEKHLAHM